MHTLNHFLQRKILFLLNIVYFSIYVLDFQKPLVEEISQATGDGFTWLYLNAISFWIILYMVVHFLDKCQQWLVSLKSVRILESLQQNSKEHHL